jgi:capsular polysaccharide export protein
MLGAAMGIPIIAPGHAVYSIPDITHQGGPDTCWQTPASPDAETFNASCRILIERCPIPGGFFSKEALDRVVRHSIARFEGKRIPSE